MGWKYSEVISKEDAIRKIEDVVYNGYLENLSKETIENILNCLTDDTESDLPYGCDFNVIG